MVHIEVIEFELYCPEHGEHRILVPCELPRPRACAHCYRPANRREIRRFMMDRPLSTSLGNEAWVG